jgi:hypothetical protein
MVNILVPVNRKIIQKWILNKFCVSSRRRFFLLGQLQSCYRKENLGLKNACEKVPASQGAV